MKLSVFPFYLQNIKGDVSVPVKTASFSPCLEKEAAVKFTPCHIDFQTPISSSRSLLFPDFALLSAGVEEKATGPARHPVSHYLPPGFFKNMDKFVIWTKRQSSSSMESSTTTASQNIDGNVGDSSENLVRDIVIRDEDDSRGKRVRLKSLFDGDVISDPGLRKPIDEYDTLVKDDVRREYVIKGPCQPLSHDFPRSDFGMESRCFQSQWFKQWEWLEYSVSKDAAFCFWCFLFKGKSGKRIGNEVFVKTGFRNWKRGCDKFREHVGAPGSTHNVARRLFFAFEAQIPSPKRCVRVLGDSYHSRLSVIVSLFKFLLPQGLAYQEPNEAGRGNFLELLDWLCSLIVEIKKLLKDNEQSYQQLTSPRIQKEIVSVCASETTKAMISDIGDKVFSLLIDVARDHLEEKQMAVVVRYVNNHGEVVERFLGVVHVVDTAIALKSGIDDFFAKHGLSISKLRGQGSNGATGFIDVRGELHGLKTLILNENPCARFIHCFAHNLQSVIVSVAYENIFVGVFFSNLSMITDMVASHHRVKDESQQKEHDSMVEMLEKGEISTKRGLHEGASRWGCSHYTTVVRLLSLWSTAIQVLDNISTLADTMETYEFVFVAHFLKLVLGSTNVLAQFLQQKDQNLLEAVSLIQNTKRKFQDLRENGWDEFLGDVNSFCATNDVDIPNMEDNVRDCWHYRRSGHVITNYQHFRVGIFSKVIDLIVEEMENRFSEASTKLLACIACLDPKNSFSNFSESKLSQLAELYPEDFSACDRMELKEQLKMWISEMRGNESFSELQDIGDLAKMMVEVGFHKAFHLVYRLIELVLVLPVVAATVERASYGMKVFETDSREKTGEASLSDCLVCYIESDVFKSIDDEAILQHFPEHESLQDVL